MRVALVGHGCSPKRGSEPGVTWNWAAQLSRFHDVTLISFPENREDVEEELAQRPRERLKVEWVTLDKRIDPWRTERGPRGIRAHYLMWQHPSFKRVRELNQRTPFDLVHHVSWASLHQPPLLWKLGLPFIWGPIGGGQIWPSKFFRYVTQGRMLEHIRSAVVHLPRWNPWVRSALRGAELVLASNGETADLIRTLGAKRVEYFADSGIHPSWLHPTRRTGTAGKLNMLWAGQCEPRKGLPLALEAMAVAPDPGIRLTCAGDGPCLEEWKQLANRLGLGDRVQFLGKVPWLQMAELFTSHDVFVFPSLRDSQGTVVLEAIARGLPLIALNHQGVANVLSDDAGIKVPVTDPQSTIRGLADAMRTLADHPSMREQMGERALSRAAEHLWEKRVLTMNQWYEEVVKSHRKP